MTKSPIATHRTTELIHLGVIAVLFIASGLCWSHAPERVPVHWNLEGEVDRWGSRLEGLFLLPALALGIYALLRFIPLLDPGRENYRLFAKPYTIIRLSLTGICAVIHAAILAFVLGFRIDIGLVVGLAVGLMFLVIGNFMGKIRPNWFVGIRTPWTLSSKLSWTKTHRVGGWIFIALGVGILSTALIRTSWTVSAVVIGAVGGSLGLVVYSYFVWKNDPDRVSPAGSSPASDEPNGTS